MPAMRLRTPKGARQEMLPMVQVGSVFGIFAPNPDNENGITIVQTVREANAEYEAQIAGIKSRYDYDMCFVTGNPCEWSLAIFFLP